MQNKVNNSHDCYVTAIGTDWGIQPKPALFFHWHHEPAGLTETLSQWFWHNANSDSSTIRTVAKPLDFFFFFYRRFPSEATPRRRRLSWKSKQQWQHVSWVTRSDSRRAGSRFSRCLSVGVGRPTMWHIQGLCPAAAATRWLTVYYEARISESV